MKTNLQHRVSFFLFLGIVLALLPIAGAQETSFVTSDRNQLGTELNKTASVRLGDLDGDRDLDIVVANGRHWPQQNFAFINSSSANRGTARFAVMRPIGTDRSTTYACELADFDGDGDLDLATGNDMSPCGIYLNDSKGRFELKDRFGDVSSVRSLSVADIDSDGDTDILMTCRRRQNWIFLNDGLANFETKIKFGSATDSTINVAVGDVDGDGDNDLVLANRDRQPNAWLLNDGMKFSKSVSFGSPKSQSRAVVIGDFDGDKKLDWAVGNIGQTNRLFLGDGTGGVKKEVEFGTNDRRTYCLAAADLDLDGDLDLVVGNAGQSNEVYFNNGAGEKFRLETFGEETGTTYGLDIGDLNGDSLPDIAVANSDGFNRVFINRISRKSPKEDKQANGVAPVKPKQAKAAPTATNPPKTDAELAEFLARPEYNTSDWPSFRGLGARGVAEGFSLPEQWNADPESGELKNVLWQTEVPGLGHSSPVVHGNRLFLLTAVAKDGIAPLKVESGGKPTAADDNGEQNWLLLCYDKTNGQELWRKTLRQGKPQATRHAKATHANTSVCLAGDKVVTFLGSEGLYCHDLNGELIWKQDLGVIDISKYGIGWGFSSSPVVHQDRIVLVCDDPDDPFLSARRLSDGEEIWRTSRKDICERSWGTPLIHPEAERTQVVVNGWPWIVSYDLATGKEIWRLKGGGDNPVPTPFEANGLIYITNAHGGPSPVYAIQPTASGDITNSNATSGDANSDGADQSAIVWSVDRGGSYMSTPVVYHDQIYLGGSRGIVHSFDANNGDQVFRKRLGTKAGVVASLVAGDGKIYCASENGTVFVLKHGREFKVVAENKMGDPCLASPAISAGTLFIRTTKKLVAIKTDDERKDDTQKASQNDAVQNDAQNEHSPTQHPSKLSDDKDVQKEPATRKNVLFIAIDDLRPSLGCYGDKLAITPSIDSLARKGLVFDQAYCQVAVCNPSRASLMTGQKPDKLGVWTLPIHFREAKPDAVTLPQWFRKFGYTAVSHGKIYHNPTPDPQSWSEPIRKLPKLGYPYPDGTKQLIEAAKEELPDKDWRKDNLRAPCFASPDLPDNQLLDGAQTDMAIEDLLRLSKSDKPFFLAMGYIRPHLSWVAPQKYWDLHDAANLPVLTAETVNENTPKYALHNNSELSHYVDLIDMPKPWDDETLPEHKMRQMVHAYYACASYIDAQVGRLLAALEESGAADNTIVVLWSDHGYKLGEYRGWGKMTNYEIDTRVPLIISAPGMQTGKFPTAGKQTHQLAELLDLFPTLCEMNGVDTPDFVDGKSLVPILKDPHTAVREVASSQYYRKQNGEAYMGYAIRTLTHRMIEWRHFSTGEVAENELYDHETDPLEKHNVYAEAPQELTEQLSELMVQTHPRKGLVLTPAVHSNPSSGRLETEISFDNRTETSVMIVPVSKTGKRLKKKIKRIDEGESATFKAKIGDVFVAESSDGKLHEIHSPTFPASSVVLKTDE